MEEHNTQKNKTSGAFDALQNLEKTVRECKEKEIEKAISAYDLGTAALNKSEFERAAMIFRGAIVPSSADEKYNWGAAYMNGIGNIPINYEKAFHWFNLAAAEQYAEAERAIGCMYQHGYYVEKNEKKAFMYYQQASTHGDAQSRGLLGWCYMTGFGTEKDEKYAFSLFNEAAELGDLQSMVNLAVCYENGDGTPVNIAEAVSRYKIAVNHGWIDEEKNIERLEKLCKTTIYNT